MNNEQIQKRTMQMLTLKQGKLQLIREEGIEWEAWRTSTNYQRDGMSNGADELQFKWSSLGGGSAQDAYFGDGIELPTLCCKIHYAEFEFICLQLQLALLPVTQRQARQPTRRETCQKLPCGPKPIFTAFVKNDWNFNSVLKFVILNMRRESAQQPSPCCEGQNDAEEQREREDIKIQAKVCMESEQSIKQTNFEEGLKTKLQRLRLFIDNLGALRDSPINPDSLEQLEIEEEVYRNVGFDTVLQETEKRIEKMTKTRKLKRNWSICDLKILIWLISKHCERDGMAISDIHNHDDSWELISSLIPGTNAESCLFKWLSLKRHKITLHGWSEQEEQILIDLEKKHAESRNKWKYISEELYSLNANSDKIYRHPKQCREHYASFLDPSIKKGPWTKEEDLMLLSHIIENSGEKKWCRLVKILEGRTENAIKNRFQLVFAKLKKKKENKSKPELELITEYVKENGGVLPTIKKQRDQAVNNQSPPPSIKQNTPEEDNQPKEPAVKWPVIPTFNIFPSSRSITSAFTPCIQEPLFQQLTDNIYRGLTKKVVSMEAIPFDKQE